MGEEELENFHGCRLRGNILSVKPEVVDVVIAGLLAAEPVAFPVLRDKIVHNIVDGLQACYDGGPGANPKFICDANRLLFGADPVALDAVAHGIIKERIAAFLDVAEKLGLDVAAREKIAITKMNLG
jgi:hypothetical protein